MTDFAAKAWNLAHPADPIIRSLLDTDFYKLSMQQMIWANHPNVRVRFQFKNRTTGVRLADVIPIEAVLEQFDYARTLRFTRGELLALRGETFYGKKDIFSSGYVNMLETFSLPEYEIEIEDGQYILYSDAPWYQSTLWEIPFLAIISELYVRAQQKSMTRTELEISYARAKDRLYAKLVRLKAIPDLNITDFATRRRHSFLWHQWCNELAIEVLEHRFTGTSNVHFALKYGIEPRGTNAHELPMVFAALADRESNGDPEAIRQSQYQVLKEFQTFYSDNMRVFLPDTFGTTQFLDNAPDWLVYWRGPRPDSKNPYDAADEQLTWWKRHGLTPDEIAKRMILFSDGLDVDLHDGRCNGEDIVGIYRATHNHVQPAFGWGTNFANDFRGLIPGKPNHLDPLSIVAKAVTANGTPTVKLSDNPAKATGICPQTIERYKQIFGVEGIGPHVQPRV